MESIGKKVVELNIEDVLPNRFQPRIKFNEEAINELSKSIKEHGVIQPIVVRPIGDKYEIIAGERRYKASCMAELKTIPAIITDLNDKDSAEVALIENVQRENLTPIEEAISYKKILDMGYITQDALAVKLGKTQSTIANKLRLLNLDDDVQEALLKEKISERHARSLLRLQDKEQQRNMLNRIISERLPVRRADEEIEKILNSETTNEPKEINNEINQIEQPEQKEIEQPKTMETLDELPKDTDAPSFKFINFPTNNDVEEKEEPKQEELKPGKFFNILNEEEKEEKKELPQNEFNFDSLFMNPISNTTTSNALLDEIAEIERSINNSNTSAKEEPKQELKPETQSEIKTEETIDDFDDFDDFDADFEPINEEEEQPNEQVEQQEIETQPESITPSEPKFIKPRINNFKDVLQAIRDCSDRIEEAGFVIDEEEYDLEGMYQVVFKIKKND